MFEVRVVFVHLILFQIENWKSKIPNRDFQCLIPQELKITNLQSQSSFCFQFPPPKIQAIKNSDLTKQFMCSKFCKKRCYCCEIQNKNRFLIFLFMKNKIANRPKIPVMEGEGKTGSGATAKKMAVVLKWTSVPCLGRAVFRGNVRPTAI